VYSSESTLGSFYAREYRLDSSDAIVRVGIALGWLMAKGQLDLAWQPERRILSAWRTAMDGALL
jgi:hypothetical protein